LWKSYALSARTWRGRARAVLRAIRPLRTTRGLEGATPK
jgi:hypothetical protein